MKRALLAALLVGTAVCASQSFAAREMSPCAALQKSTVGSALGIKVVSTRAIAQPAVPGLTVCFFATSSNPVAVSIAFQTQTGKTTYASDVALTNEYVKTVSGLGDKAFANSSNPGGNTSLYVLKGNVLVSFVTAAPLSKVEKLAKLVVATL